MPSTNIPDESENISDQITLSAREVISSMSFFLSVVRESILSLGDGEKFVDSEITVEMIQDIRQLRLQMNDTIMESLNSDPEVGNIPFCCMNMIRLFLTLLRKPNF